MNRWILLALAVAISIAALVGLWRLEESLQRQQPQQCEAWTPYWNPNPCQIPFLGAIPILLFVGILLALWSFSNGGVRP